MRARAAAWVVLVGLVATACSSGNGDDGDTGGDGGDERADTETAGTPYLEQVTELEQQRVDTIEEVGQVLTRSYNTRELFVETVRESLADDPLAGLADQARELDPLPRFEDAHARWVESLQEAESRAEDIEAALGDDDLVAAVQAFDAMGDALARAVVASPLDFCRAVIITFAGGADRICRDPADLPAGAYGAGLNQAFRTLEVHFRVTLLPGLTDAELATYVAERNPFIEEAIAQAARTVEALDPPSDFSDDHSDIVGYLDKLGSLAAEITAAAESGDVDEMRSLFDRSVTVAREAREALSEPALEILGPFLMTGPA